MILLECGCGRVMHIPDSDAEFFDRDEPKCPSCRAKAERALQEQLDQFIELDQGPRDQPASCAVLILAAVAVMVLMALLGGCDRKDGPTDKETCLLHGYPKIVYGGGSYFCKRQVLGTDEVVPVEKLRARENREQMVRSMEKAFGQGGAK